jgi:tRNA threonylcarbamoyladenosine biosynthesis protein TsaB
LSKARKSAASSSGSRTDLALLGFDTATEDTAVCLTVGDEVAHESLLGLSSDGSPGHTTRLLGEVETAVAAAGGWDAVERIAVGVGPGSFTGLRVGIATARGLGASRGLPVAGVCTLDALAAGIAEAGGEGRELLAVIDARRGEAFAASYRPDGSRAWGPWVGGPDELRDRLGQGGATPLAAGSGALRFRDELASWGVEVIDGADASHRVAARHICRIAAAGGTVEPLAPIYLRPPDAERWRERDTANRNQ